MAKIYARRQKFDDVARQRYEMTLDLLPNLAQKKILDADQVNPFTKYFYDKRRCETFNLSPHKNFDLDEFGFNGFDVVFSFEVIEHLMNPLHYLLECRSALKESGVIYITTPVYLAPFKYKFHFHEMRKDELESLIKEAGFKIVEMRKMRIFSLRPIKFIRWVFGKWWFVKCVKEQ